LMGAGRVWNFEEGRQPCAQFVALRRSPFCLSDARNILRTRKQRTSSNRRILTPTDRPGSSERSSEPAQPSAIRQALRTYRQRNSWWIDTNLPRRQAETDAGIHSRKTDRTNTEEQTQRPYNRLPCRCLVASSSSPAFLLRHASKAHPPALLVLCAGGGKPQQLGAPTIKTCGPVDSGWADLCRGCTP
jgi:hypothetical protein